MNKLLAIACIAAALVCCLPTKTEQPKRYREVYYNHTVQYGESIHDIANKYIEMHAGKDYPRFVFAIRFRNGLMEGKQMAVGDVLLIPCLQEVNE